MKFWIYNWGLLYASVCSSLSLEETTEQINRELPTGIKSPWRLSSDKTFHTGETNPCACQQHPDTHKHYLFNC